jgi:hypothetical protein
VKKLLELTWYVSNSGLPAVAPSITPTLSYAVTPLNSVSMARIPVADSYPHRELWMCGNCLQVQVCAQRGNALGS